MTTSNQVTLVRGLVRELRRSVRSLILSYPLLSSLPHPHLPNLQNFNLTEFNLISQSSPPRKLNKSIVAQFRALAEHSKDAKHVAQDLQNATLFLYSQREHRVSRCCSCYVVYFFPSLFPLAVVVRAMHGITSFFFISFANARVQWHSTPPLPLTVSIPTFSVSPPHLVSSLLSSLHSRFLGFTTTPGTN